MSSPMVFVLDNYDSFTFNLVQYLGELGADVSVARNDAVNLDDVGAMSPDGVVISPGPGVPADAGLSNDLVRWCAGRGMPMLGVCLGHQAVAETFGGRIIRADQIMHGKTSQIVHDSTGVLVDVPSPFEATRYHSLCVDPASVPSELIVNAHTTDGVVMGLRHRSAPVHGVQFHPESILTGEGMRILGNFLGSLRASAPA